MKKYAFIAVFCLFFFASLSSATGLYINYNPTTETLWVEGSKFITWGCNDEEVVEWDRFVLGENKLPQMFLVAYGVGESKLAAYQLPVSKQMLFYGKLDGVPPGTEFQIKALVWKNNVPTWQFWAIDTTHPIPAELNSRGVIKIQRDPGWIFKTTLCQ
ncbi:MAG: hypothetical protein US30_C0001G0097 [Candidatus Moranbacteria bacterium GW2011_GWF2_36_839]|nr:MAG: hypothetical protein US27_C0001G0097 [Candidatus Moranbacteria bacterium GW2011_GWF1_36_78]KKQ17763.1 MAG: hypothetical protein US30_C0001G0097 [Candidatus Moranbacteria bacterium GW2011_GWF2_36_839]HAT73464.1 hypothetical protein [Candidatus Moranbacteria bacterium]HBY10826.1 hypothetical protein [Candidatus Moranbacteria bacterium]